MIRGGSSPIININPNIRAFAHERVFRQRRWNIATPYTFIVDVRSSWIAKIPIGFYVAASSAVRVHGAFRTPFVSNRIIVSSGRLVVASLFSFLLPDELERVFECARQAHPSANEILPSHLLPFAFTLFDDLEPFGRKCDDVRDAVYGDFTLQWFVESCDH